MSIRQHVFSSDSEQKLYHSITKRWGNRFAVYPNLPFANIIEVRRVAGLTEQERRYLLSTSVDYTLCTKDGDRPLLSIEFDGLSQGFSRDGRYVPIPALADPERSRKLDLKVRVAERVGYPLIVVSYHEKNPLDEGLHLALVDGIIGQVLAHREFESSLPRRLAELEPTLEALSPWERHEAIQDALLDLEFETELEWNPILRELSVLEYELSERGVLFGWGMRVSWKDEDGREPPEVDVFNAFRDASALERLEARI